MTTDKLQYSVKRSKRKTLAIRVEHNGEVTVLAPMRLKNSIIEAAVEKNREWIEKKRAQLADAREKYDRTPISQEELDRLTVEGKRYIPNRVKELADLFEIEINNVSVRALRSKWGSCSSKKNISVNCLLMLAPVGVLDYIIIHELCHLKHMNHSKQFYAEVDSLFADRKACEKWLKTEGAAIIDRAKSGAFK